MSSMSTTDYLHLPTFELLSELQDLPLKCGDVRKTILRIASEGLVDRLGQSLGDVDSACTNGHGILFQDHEEAGRRLGREIVDQTAGQKLVKRRGHAVLIGGGFDITVVGDLLGSKIG